MFCADPASYVCLSGYGPGDLEEYRGFGEAGERDCLVGLLEEADSVMLALHPAAFPARHLFIAPATTRRWAIAAWPTAKRPTTTATGR